MQEKINFDDDVDKIEMVEEDEDIINDDIVHCLVGAPVEGMHGYFYPVPEDTTEPFVTRHSPLEGHWFTKTQININGELVNVWKYEGELPSVESLG